MPELLVTLLSGLQNNADLAIANIVGSNIANVLLVLGCAAIIRPLPVKNSTVVSEIPFSLTAALLLGFLANAALFSTVPELSISRLDGAILLFFFLLFLVYVYMMSKQGDTEQLARRPGADHSIPRSSIYIALGIVGLYAGGQLVVTSAVDLANIVGIDDSVIGLTIVAVGTSLPELVASCVAAYRGETDIAVGNVVGSNIFNILWIVGFTASIVELPFEAINNTDLVMVIVASTLILLSLVISRSNTILRWHGAVFTVLYAGYLAFVIDRG